MLKRHTIVIAVFMAASAAFGLFVRPGDTVGEQIVLAGAFLFGLCYLYFMLVVSFWVRKKFEEDRKYDPRKEAKGTRMTRL